MLSKEVQETINKTNDKLQGVIEGTFDELMKKNINCLDAVVIGSAIIAWSLSEVDSDGDQLDVDMQTIDNIIRFQTKLFISKEDSNGKGEEN